MHKIISWLFSFWSHSSLIRNVPFTLACSVSFPLVQLVKLPLNPMQRQRWISHVIVCLCCWRVGVLACRVCWAGLSRSCSRNWHYFSLTLTVKPTVAFWRLIKAGWHQLTVPHNKREVGWLRDRGQWGLFTVGVCLVVTGGPVSYMITFSKHDCKFSAVLGLKHKLKLTVLFTHFFDWTSLGTK